MSDIVERLRVQARPKGMEHRDVLDVLMTEAADEIERLTAFYDEGTMTLAYLRKDLLHAADEIERLRAKEERIAALEADVKKWKFAFTAQSRKLRCVLDIPGVRATLKEVGGGDA